MDLCNHHSPPAPVSDSGWNPSYHCYDNLHTQDKERFDNNIIFKWFTLFCGYF